MTDLSFSSNDYLNLAKILLGINNNTNIGPNLYNIVHDADVKRRQDDHPNEFCRFGRKIFSQTDEDGLVFEIMRRIEISDGRFCEIGVGNGMENNTLALVAAGWKGFWLGGEDLAYSIFESKKLAFQKAWITAENVFELYSKHLVDLGVGGVDLVSIDLDGNDYYVVKSLLESGVNPEVFIVEYNAKFTPPIRFSIKYNPGHVWQGDDYFGASLCQFNDLFEEFGYVLVCCNAATGSNAFFVKKEHFSKFPETPKEIQNIYASPNYDLYLKYGHPPSIRTVELIVNGGGD